MPGFDAEPDYSELAHVVRDPDAIGQLTAEDLARVLDAANAARLLGWTLERCRERGVPVSPPRWLADRLTSAEAFSRSCEQAIRWEINRLERAFLGTGVRWVLLKGAAYVAAQLPPGIGRRVADIDVLVSRDDLDRAEAALTAHGWEIPPLTAYDERYYRDWMHELPPMVHRDRRSIVDLHHAILPRTSRLTPASERLLEGSIEVGAVRVLSPPHMVLHAAAHMFHDGEIAGAIRDLVDLDQLLRTFARDARFWPALIGEAEALGLTRPLFYAMRYVSRWFATPVPDAAAAVMAGWGPPAAVRITMDTLVERSIATAAGRGSSLAVLSLYVRSHWLRMPPLQVVRHLTRKAFARERPPERETP
jgi:hypothetical protein